VTIDWSRFFPGETKEGTIDFPPIGAVVSLTATKPPTSIRTSREKLSFMYPQATKTFEIWNSGAGTLDWTVIGDCNWLDVSPESGSSTGEHDTVTVTISWSGFSSGETKECDIQFSSNGGGDSVHVVATKPEGPLMCVSPKELSITYPDAGGVFWVWNCGEDTLRYSLFYPDWAIPSPWYGTSVGEQKETTVYIDWSQFSPGDTKVGIIEDYHSPEFVWLIATKPAPSICTSPEELSFTYPEATKSFEIWNCGAGTLNYLLSAWPEWASLSEWVGSSTGERDKIDVTIDWSQISPGETEEGVVSDYHEGIIVSLTVNFPAGTPPAYLLE
jgi:hypothetical protein